MPPTFDLQSHSVHSDGSLPPAEVVARAAGAGVELLALTDHDSVDGVGEALAAARTHGIALVPAVELSAVHAAYEDLHILGYGLDHADPRLAAQLEDWRGDRGRRIGAMIDRLQALGLALDRTPLERRARAGGSVGRPHLAQAILGHPANAARLADEGIAGPDELFPAYLVPGAPAYVARERPTVREAIAAVHAAGGVAVWAHPFWDLVDPRETLDALAGFVREDGLDGVECFYVTHTAAQTRLLHAAAAEHGLITTGSADFHGPGHDRFHAFRAFELHGLTPHLGPIGARAT